MHDLNKEPERIISEGYPKPGNEMFTVTPKNGRYGALSLKMKSGRILSSVVKTGAQIDGPSIDDKYRAACIRTGQIVGTGIFKSSTHFSSMIDYHKPLLEKSKEIGKNVDLNNPDFWPTLETMATEKMKES